MQGDKDAVEIPHIRKDKLCVYPAVGVAPNELSEVDDNDSILKIPPCEIFGIVDECSNAPSPPATPRQVPAQKRKKISRRTNTPLFGLIEDAYLRRKKKLTTSSYGEHITKLCKSFGCVVKTLQYCHSNNIWQQHSCFKNSLLLIDDNEQTADYQYFRGFLSIGDIAKVTSLPSLRVVALVNTYFWGRARSSKNVPQVGNSREFFI